MCELISSASTRAEPRLAVCETSFHVRREPNADNAFGDFAQDGCERNRSVGRKKAGVLARFRKRDDELSLPRFRELTDAECVVDKVTDRLERAAGKTAERFSVEVVFTACSALRSCAKRVAELSKINWFAGLFLDLSGTFGSRDAVPVLEESFAGERRGARRISGRDASILLNEFRGHCSGTEVVNYFVLFLLLLLIS